MHPEFWHQRWSANQIGFHESQANPLLVAHWGALAAPPAARVFVPLCGKTLDIDWLLARGCSVVGAELSRLAAAQLFERLGQSPAIDRNSPVERWSVPELDLFVGDFFDVTMQQLGRIDAVYDRAALVALPPEVRPRYARHLDLVTRGAPQLLVSFDYDQSQLAGPPFAVTEAELRRLYPPRRPAMLASHALPGGLKGLCPAFETVWLLPAATRGSAPDRAPAASAP